MIGRVRLVGEDWGYICTVLVPDIVLLQHDNQSAAATSTYLPTVLRTRSE